MVTPECKCGTKLREALQNEIESSLPKRYWYGDYGKIWFCDKCNRLVWCA
jgi:uncharacterized protein with PIN domain